jgi:type I restriction enzyme M protein
MPTNNAEIEKRLWDAADELRANSRLKASEYSVPVLGLIFLRYADHKFAWADKEIKAERAAATTRRQRPITTLEHRAGHQRGDEGCRGGEPGPQRRAAQDLQPPGQ